ncbi:MAG: type II toxin-antitoxin system VapC family toxin [Thermoanaerobaculia bacterium]
MSAFVDTSALLAVLDLADQDHAAAAATLRSLLDADEDLVTSNYVLVETFALVQSRLGLGAIRLLQQDLVPILRVAWLDEDAHRAAVTALLTASRRRLSLVDCSSFETMRRFGITRAFAFDGHFAEQGFELVTA